MSLTSDTHRLPFMLRRPSPVATPADAHLPLHVQKPAVRHLCWDRADAIVSEASSINEAALWRSFTAIYRHEDAVLAIFAERSHSLDVPATASSSLLQGDLEVLLDCGFAVPAHCPARSYIRIFSVLEKGDTRRRVITWPRALNSAEKALLRRLRTQHFDTTFPRVSGIRDGARTHSATLDFRKFFQQFCLASACRPFFAFHHHGVDYFLDTVPTGATGPPLAAHILARAMCLLAIRRSLTTALVIFCVCIDNIRMASHDLHALRAAWAELMTIIHFVGATVGDLSGPLDAPSDYVFLGQHFLHDGTVRVGPKTRAHLVSARGFLASRQPVTVLDVLVVFGRCVWASAVLDLPLHGQYHILKFCRRKARLPLSETILVWPSIIPLWLQWIDTLTSRVYVPGAHVSDEVVAFSDASSSGWGAVLFLDRGLPSIFAGSWTPAEARLHINVLELLAVKRLFTHAAATLRNSGVHLLVDNTTALSWLRKRRSSCYLANAISQDIHAAASDLGIRLLSVSWVASASNIADAPSRGRLPPTT